MTDIEIAESVKPIKIKEIAKKLNLRTCDYELYGNYKAKVSKKYKVNENSKHILVTAINPTSA